jgi:uncharacterized membrane protein YbaN (DUF454 family)
MRSSRFFVRVLLSYSYLFIGLLSFGVITLFLPDLLPHPFTVVAAVAFIAGWIWVAKTYLGFTNTDRHTHDGA